MPSIALALAPKPFSLVSILCSYVVLRETSHPANRTKKRDRAIRACLKNFAIAEIIMCAALFMTTWPIPTDVADYFQNAGTTATCSAQGFFMELGDFATSLFSVQLSVLFVLMVRYNAMESTLVNIQYWSQIVIWGVSLLFSTLFLGFGFYNPNTAYCWLGPYPYDCWWSEEGECIRGATSYWAIYIHLALAFFGSILGQLVMFAWLYITVHEVEDPGRRNSQSIRQFSSAMRQGSSQNFTESSATATPQSVNRTRSRAVAVRGLWYIGGYMLTYFLSFVEVILQLISVSVDISIPAACLLATQGLWTSMVFMRNRKMLTPEGKLLRNKVLCCLMPSSDVDTKQRDSPPGQGKGVSTQFPSCTSSQGDLRVIVGFDGKPKSMSDLQNSAPLLESGLLLEDTSTRQKRLDDSVALEDDATAVVEKPA